ncbi:MAG: hypothetical protein E7387_00040 [Ruminococcaceae bacterium]|nr:hypothetical protein [Oscillospiraceae bacterium]
MKRRNRYYKIGKQIKNPPKKQFIKETESIYEIPEKIIFSPTTCASSEENKKAENNNTSNSNNFFNGLLDKILNDDFLIIGLIVILLIERFNLKKSGADKNTLNEYDLMIAALIYIYF